jgi:hypothetical protein
MIFSDKEKLNQFGCTKKLRLGFAHWRSNNVLIGGPSATQIVEITPTM